MKRRVPALAALAFAAVIAVFSYGLFYGEKSASTGTADLNGSIIAETDQATAGTASITKKAGKGKKADPADDQPNPIIVPETEGIVPGGFIRAKVIRIVDGDTIKVEYKGKDYRVRLLCIDTPESVKEGVAVQPYAKEASDALSGLLFKKEVSLVFDMEVEDSYERLLAFVMLEDGSCANAEMISQGFARVDAVKPNTTFKSYFNQLQDAAVREGRGLWSLPEEERPFEKNEKGHYVPKYYKDAA